MPNAPIETIVLTSNNVEDDGIRSKIIGGK